MGRSRRGSPRVTGGILLHPHYRAPRNGTRYRETWAWLEAHSAKLDRLGYEVRHERVSGEHGYPELLARYWEGPGDLVVLEHDVVPQFARKAGSFEAFFACAEEYCAVDYPLWLRQHGRAQWLLMDDNTEAFVCVEHDYGPFTSFRHEVQPGSNAYWWGNLGERWADLACLGLTRFSERLRRSVPFAQGASKWNVLDTNLAIQLHKAGHQVHVHYPRAGHRHPTDSRPHRFTWPDGRAGMLLHPKQLPEKWAAILTANAGNGPRPGPITYDPKRDDK